MSATLTHHHAGHHGSHHGLFDHLRETLATWRERSRTRARLADLDAHMLRDIGLDPESVEHEIRKPFWRV